MTNKSTITYSAFTQSGQLNMIVFTSPRFDTMTEAEALAAMFPKTLKVEAYKLIGSDRNAYTISLREIHLLANGVNGGRNETGIKRFQRIRKICADNGIEFTYVPFATNSADVDF